jgi:hypothetical protein
MIKFKCSNPACGAVHDTDPKGHCPACVQPSGVGYSARPIDLDLRAFHNRIRSLFCIDGCDLPDLAPDELARFLADPVRYFIRTDDAKAGVIWRAVEARKVA